jgi:hypothetical protein
MILYSFFKRDQTHVLINARAGEVRVFNLRGEMRRCVPKKQPLASECIHIPYNVIHQYTILGGEIAHYLWFGL